MDDYTLIWNNFLADLRTELGSDKFDAWFTNASFESFENNQFCISLPDVLTMEWIESRYMNFMREKLSSYFPKPVQLKLIVKNNNNNNHVQLNPKYVFDSFVVGNSNRFAHAACFAVAEAPSRSYNPLFIYGGVGLGKTHLMQAVGHHILQKSPSMNVVYVSSEQFTNELINSIRDDKTSEFRAKYRNIDVLLIDDIQFLAGKERTQEEFFHTFNALYEANKQLVISSDRPPREIPTLEDRLRSRFEWGLITDIQPPDLETRIAILKKKSQLDGLTVPDDVMNYIAVYIQSNIRELEGALNRIVAYSNFTNRPITLDLATEALKDILPSAPPKKITIEMIQQVVAEYFTINVSDLISKRRTRQLAFPRQIAMYLARELTDSSLPTIGEFFGGRDHTTALHAYDKISREMKSDPVLDRIITELTSNLQKQII